ncbi:von Willebrand domain-containing protein, variant [Blastomyces dermatitidis ER-3]|uniref:von Willebrand domain-containing protein, variant n=1 Tax=Ajellomyces dermatitidis (strain ER-3 / ATCC MYA-2586) TaxID=559297 RepID=A0ABX2VXA2_AJEDR|nr:von Willebrand domain-containing protein, variant [Blastomyces dermatitidis ER-3]OAT01781.1 von Willebrand domain-containing protein, variant [Blastomyces dermatitidis ER-3]
MSRRPNHLLPKCGCWYSASGTRQYIPQVDLKAHSTILSTSSRTTLTQTFINPTSGELGDVKYTFPLHDGVSVVGFKCEIDNRVIHGLVKERQEAKLEYQDAVKKGQAAALLEQSALASDTFTTSIGKIPVGSKAVVQITYLGELQHDSQADGVRFSIPAIICPRYANSSVDTGELSQSLASFVKKGAINITVDVSVDRGSTIRGLHSPTHPVAITLGRTSVAAQDLFEPNLASAAHTMQQGNAFFDTDFVLIVNAKDQDVPSAFVEKHPTIPNQRAVMATLVPKFNIPNNNPEIVFIIDRSGSMTGNIKTLQSALRVFLKSLPVGVKFNICSFGSRHSFMWNKSKTYDASSLKAALQYVDSIAADFGGTEMLEPVKATVKNRLKDLDLDVLLLSDGEIWDQKTLFAYLNEVVSEQPIRLFSLGIGSGASQSLIEGIARAGDGFAQFVGDNEQLDKKVVRMLKGALTPHIKDYTAEIVYENDGGEDFELIEKPNAIPTGENFGRPAERSAEPIEVDSQKETPQSKEPISLFDPSYQEPDIKSITVPLDANLPKLQPPKVLQAPYKIPTLYPFTRTTVYFLLSPDAPSAALKSLVLRATSKHGPLMLKIPLEDIGQGTKLHQLAARKVTLELEEGRGWIYHTKNEKGQLIVNEHESKKEDIVKREAVRLGIQFQVAGKYCSFVAVESTTDGGKADKKAEAGLPGIRNHPISETAGDRDHTDDEESSDGDTGFVMDYDQEEYTEELCTMPRYSTMYSPLGEPLASGGFGSPFSTSSSSHTQSRFAAPPQSASTRLFGSAPPPPGQATSSPFGPPAVSTSSGIDIPLKRGERLDGIVSKSDDLAKSANVFARKRSSVVPSAKQKLARFFKSESEPKESKSPQDKVHALISHQSFEGSWMWEDNVFAIMDLNASEAEKKLDWAAILGKQSGVGSKDTKQRSIVATLVVLAYLKKKCLDEKDTWELVGDKAMGWAVERIKEIGGNAGQGSDELLRLFDGLF